MTKPTYSAKEILNFCATVKVEQDSMQAIAYIIEEEINLYNDEELVILMQASMIMFTRCLLIGSMKFL